MATKFQAWESSDGTLFRTRKEALARDRETDERDYHDLFRSQRSAFVDFLGNIMTGRMVKPAAVQEGAASLIKAYTGWYDRVQARKDLEDRTSALGEPPRD